MAVLDFENLEYFEFTKNSKNLTLSFKSKHVNFKCKFLSKLNEMHAMLKHTFLFLFNKLGLLQIYPPYKNLAPRFLGFRKEVGILRSETILALPGCFLLRVMGPLNFEELDALTSSFTLGFIKDTDRIFTIG